MLLIDCVCTSKCTHRFHTHEIEVTIGSSPEGGMMEILLSQSAQATVKRMQSHLSGLTLVSTGLRQYVGSELVEAGALYGSSRGRALVRKRIEEDPTFNSCFAWRRPPQCGWKRGGRGPVVARMPQSPFRTGGSDRRAEHQPPKPRVPRERAIHRNVAPGSLSGFTGRARIRNVPARRPSGRRSSAHRFLGGEAA
jgi:hypothetical protein